MPAGAESAAFKINVEVVVPLAGTVTGLGRITLTPDGAVPTQASVNATCELKLFTEETTSETDW